MKIKTPSRANVALGKLFDRDASYLLCYIMFAGEFWKVEEAVQKIGVRRFSDFRFADGTFLIASSPEDVLGMKVDVFAKGR